MAKTLQDLEIQTFGVPEQAQPASLLERLQIRPGTTVLYVGCPGPGALETIASQVGPSGGVTLVAAEASVAAAARQLVVERHSGARPSTGRRGRRSASTAPWASTW